MEQDIKEVRCFKTKDGQIFTDREGAKKHDHNMKVRKMKEELAEDAEKFFKGIVELDDEEFYGNFEDGSYSDGILSFDDLDDVVQGAMTIVDLWDGKFLRYIKHVEKKIKKV